MLELRGAAAELAVVAGGTAVTLGFGLYDARHGGLRLWAQPAAQVLLVEGIWTVTLGEPPAPVLDESVLASPSLWLEIRLDGKPAGPRRKVRKVSGVLTIEGNLLSAPGPDGDKRASRSRHFYAQRAYPLEATPPGVLSRARSARAAARRTRGALASP
ncbi:MAG TPA: hypothetical protein VFP98_03385, partial [Candidatus Polarisedimenticolia bacterium]|nr:hypothetical protein [Candidatus Polarisedimenticolia bacterium]